MREAIISGHAGRARWPTNPGLAEALARDVITVVVDGPHGVAATLLAAFSGLDVPVAELEKV